MDGVTPLEVLFMNIAINGASGILPTAAIVAMGILILRRLPPRSESSAEIGTQRSSRGREERPVEYPKP